MATNNASARYDARSSVDLGEDGSVLVSPARRIAWGAVFAGVALALVVQVVLAMLGAGIGLSTVDPMQGGSPDAQTFGMAAGAWWAVSMLIALYIGGWVAGHMAGLPLKSDGTLHGLVVWAFTVLLMLYLLSSALGGVIGGAFNVMGKAAGQTAQVAANAPPGAVDAVIERARQAGVPVDAVKSPEGMTEQQKAEAAQKGREAADKAASAGSRAGIWGAIALLLGGLVAGLGGAAGRPRAVAVTPVAAH